MSEGAEIMINLVRQSEGIERGMREVINRLKEHGL